MYLIHLELGEMGMNDQLDLLEQIISNPKNPDVAITLLFLGLRDYYGYRDYVVQGALTMIGKYRSDLYEKLIRSFETALAIQRAEEEILKTIRSSTIASEILNRELEKVALASSIGGLILMEAIGKYSAA